MKPKILFVCGRNKLRGPTAERIFRNDQRVEVRSAGVSEKSPHPVSRSDLQWADLVLVMESKYRTRIQEGFRDQQLPSIESLDIPDEYEFMNEELVGLITSSVEHHIRALTEKARLGNDD
jgi:predicted protein tyrosine phosphatase